MVTPMPCGAELHVLTRRTNLRHGGPWTRAKSAPSRRSRSPTGRIAAVSGLKYFRITLLCLYAGGGEEVGRDEGPYAW